MVGAERAKVASMEVPKGVEAQVVVAKDWAGRPRLHRVLRRSSRMPTVATHHRDPVEFVFWGSLGRPAAHQWTDRVNAKFPKFPQTAARTAAEDRVSSSRSIWSLRSRLDELVVGNG